MRKITLAAVGVAAAAGLLAPATVANAATSANTDVTFIIAGGGGDLSLITGGPVGAIVPGAGGASGTLTTVTVSDNRNGSGRAWTATASTTDFVGPSMTIPKSAVTYNATAPFGVLLGGSLNSTGPQTLDTPKAVMERTGLNWPLEIITWTPALNVDFPGGAPIGTYEATVTVSVA
ncbi:hypothetical protein ERC79_12225 [Rhodococcus sp. ABRD24]|uniref:hypothetical protein n=1 Tax=Rhodococcus sp. ABRD24 TaxID=2507582 RepID=UPI00103D1400|nr:hypothetical protein [Rhodococcus sp. ABRD24]QBJ96648.1 hypothetical protein ERC79_12225 [Rhodococcus sp. ABRD24]